MVRIIIGSVLASIYVGLFLSMIIIPIHTYNKSHKENLKDKGVEENK